MSRLSRLAGRVLAPAPRHPRHKVSTVRFRRLVRNLRLLVELSEDAREKLGGEWILDRSYVAAFVAQTLDRARQIVFDSAVLTGAPSPELQARLDAVQGSLGRLMTSPPPGAGETPTVRESARDGETGGSAQLQEPEYQLLHAAIQRLALTAPGAAATGPRLAEVVQEAHERALRSLEGLRFESWGRRAGTPLVGSGLPGGVRVVDVGGGAAHDGRSEWRPRVDRGRLRSAPLRALLETAQANRGRSSSSKGEPPSPVLAVVTEEHATVDAGWPGGGLLVDTCLGEHAAANFVYCAVRGDPPGGLDALRPALGGFRFLDLGPGLTAWLQARDREETKRALGRLGGGLGALLREPSAGSRPRDGRTGRGPEMLASQNGK